MYIQSRQHRISATYTEPSAFPQLVYSLAGQWLLFVTQLSVFAGDHEKNSSFRNYSFLMQNPSFLPQNPWVLMKILIPSSPRRQPWRQCPRQLRAIHICYLSALYHTRSRGRASRPCALHCTITSLFFVSTLNLYRYACCSSSETRWQDQPPELALQYLRMMDNYVAKQTENKW